MKRYVRAAARDLKPKLSPSEMRRQDNESKKEVFRKAVELANKQMPADHQIDVCKHYYTDGLLYGAIDNVYIAHSSRRRHNHIEMADFNLKQTAQQLASDILHKVNELIDSGQLMYEESWTSDNDENVRQEYAELIASITETVDEINRTYEADPEAHPDLHTVYTDNYISVRFTISKCLGYPVEYNDSYMSTYINNVCVRSYLDNGRACYVEDNEYGYGLAGLQQGLFKAFSTFEDLIDKTLNAVNGKNQFEQDVDDTLTGFVEAFIDKYPGLSVDYEMICALFDKRTIEITRHTKYILGVTFQVYCYNNQIAFEMTYSSDEWYKTDIPKKIINAIKYRKRRDGI